MSPHQDRLPQHPVNTGRTDHHPVAIQQHVGQPPIAFERILVREVHNRPLLPGLQTMVARHRRVVFIHPAITGLPTPPPRSRKTASATDKIASDAARASSTTPRSTAPQTGATAISGPSPPADNVSVSSSFATLAFRVESSLTPFLKKVIPTETVQGNHSYLPPNNNPQNYTSYSSPNKKIRTLSYHGDDADQYTRNQYEIKKCFRKCP